MLRIRLVVDSWNNLKIC